MVSLAQFSREISKHCVGNVWQLYVCPYSLISFRDVNLEDTKSTCRFYGWAAWRCSQAGDSHIANFTFFFFLFFLASRGST